MLYRRLFIRRLLWLAVYRGLVRPLQPDVVVLGFYLNDLEPPFAVVPNTDSWLYGLLGRTAVLEFKLVRDPIGDQYADGEKTIPAGTEVLYELEKGEFGQRRRGPPLLIESTTLMTGDVVTDARVRPGDLPNTRIVALDLNARGARQ